MKNLKPVTLLITLFLFAAITFAQGKTKIVITPTNGNNSNNSDVYRMSCKRGDGVWLNGCYTVGVYCTNGGGLSIGVTVKSCLDRISDNFPDIIYTIPRFKLLDLNISIVENTQNIAIVNLQQYKNGSYEILDEIIEETTEEILVIKPGIYKVTNSKMHILIHKQAE